MVADVQRKRPEPKPNISETHVKDTDVPNHLREIYAKAREGRPEEERRKIASLLNRFEHVFSKDDDDLGTTNLLEHTINTGSSKPMKQPPRRVPLAFANEEKLVIEQMERQGIIRKSKSPWASPIVLVRKKNGNVRPCIDYRRLNSVTENDAFPLPRIQDCLDAVSGSTLYSTMDLTSGYHQVPVRNSDIRKTAFVTMYGLYEFLKMPMGLKSAPMTFQRVMELALQGLQWQICLIYLDDVVIFSKTFEEHMERLTRGFDRISTGGLKLKPEKCQLLQTEVTFLGHVVSGERVRPHPSNILKIKEWPPPQTVTQIRQFLGMASYYRRFVKDFSQIVRPMVQLTKKGADFFGLKPVLPHLKRLRTF